VLEKNAVNIKEVLEEESKIQKTSCTGVPANRSPGEGACLMVKQRKFQIRLTTKPEKAVGRRKKKALKPVVCVGGFEKSPQRVGRTGNEGTQTAPWVQKNHAYIGKMKGKTPSPGTVGCNGGKGQEVLPSSEKG